MANTSNASGAPLPGSALPILKTAAASWSMAFRALAEMAGLGALTTALLAVHGATFPHALDVETIDALPAAIFITELRMLIVLPLTIAVFRYALLHETPAASGLSLAGLRVPGAFRLARFAILYDAALALLIGLLDPLIKMELQFAAALVLVLTLALIAFGLWSAMYMPALAVDAPHPTLVNALEDAKGRLATIFWIALPIFVPLIVAFGLVGWMAQTPAVEGNVSAPVSFGPVIAKGALDTLNAALSAAMASYIYVAFADRLGRPADVVLLPPR